MVYSTLLSYFNFAFVTDDWHRQVGDVETEVTDSFNFDVRTRRVTFVAQDGIWALRFGTAAAYEKFVTRYNDKLFVNTYGVDNDEANRLKVRYPHTHLCLLVDCRGWQCDLHQAKLSS